MKRALRIVGTVLICVVGVAAGAFAWLALRRPAQRTPSAERIEPTPERLARGEYLARHVIGCVGCHSDAYLDRFSLPEKPGTEGQGGFPFDDKVGVPGVVCAQNITPDPETGVGRWTDGELLRAIREGVSRDGRALFPMMPYPFLRSLSDEDARAVVVWVRTLRPIRNRVAPTRLKFPVNFLIKSVPQPLTGPVTAPDPGADRVGYGRYLATIGGCLDCHSPRDARGAPVLEQAYTGGWEVALPGGRVVAANLTPHPGNWMGRATREQFIGRFKGFAGMTAETAPVMPPGRNTVMPWIAYGGMTEEDLGAIYDFLRTLAPVDKRIESYPDAR